MDCCDLDRLLPAYADGEFTDSDCAEIEAHLSDCATCRDEVAAHLAFRCFLQDKAGENTICAPDSLKERIRKDMARERGRDQVRRFSLYSAMAAGLMAVASAGYLFADSPRSEPPELMLLDAVDKHARALPVEVTPAGGDVESWFRGKVDFRVRAPRFRDPAAPRLVGARLANVRDRQAAYLVYGGEDSDRRTTLLVFPGSLDLPDGRKTQVGGRDVVVANQRGYNVAVWQQRGIVYSLVSDLDENDMIQLVSQVDDQDAAR